MNDIYAIETSARTAGLAVCDAAGFRFYASDQMFTTLECRRYERLAEIHTAVNRLAAAPAKPQNSRRRSRSWRTVHPALGRLQNEIKRWSQ
jgi:predicted RecB family endonuclease